MTREQAEQEIRRAIVTATSAAGLADELFAPTGLFSWLGASAQDRTSLVQTALFRDAQQRFRQLQLQEAARFATAVQNARGLSATFDFWDNPWDDEDWNHAQ